MSAGQGAGRGEITIEGNDSVGEKTVLEARKDKTPEEEKKEECVEDCRR